MSKSKAKVAATPAGAASDAVSKGADEHGFRIPRRHRTPIYYAAGAVFLIVALLVYVMARPDPERMAAGYVNTMLESLPAQRLGEDDLRAAVLYLNSAFEAVPDFGGAIEATRELQERVARQVDADITEGELDAAEELFTAAAAIWADDDGFDEAGALREDLARAREIRGLHDQIRELLAEIKRRAASESDESTGNLRTVLDQLGLALEALPADEQVPAVQADLRREMADAVRVSLDRNGLAQAQQMIDAVPRNWSGDAEILRLQEEVQSQLAALNRSGQVDELLEKAERSIAADRLSTPSGNNAVEYLRQALSLDPANARAARNLEAVADRYAVLVADALQNGALALARRHIGSLERVSPGYPRLDEFSRRIADAEAAQAEASRFAAQQAALSPGPADEPGEAEPIPQDPEGQLWFSLRNSCNERELRRYINNYPAGRYVDRAWQRISDCLAATDGP